jgi:hypothetical protein
MKSTLLILLAITCSGILKAQNYHTFNLGDTVEFGYGNTVLLDSFVDNGNETIFYHTLLYQFDPYGQTCPYPGWTGKELIRNNSTGEEVLINRYQDTIVLGNMKQLNDSWTFYQHTLGTTVTVIATVTNISEISFLNTVDTVKTIRFQCFDNGTPITTIVSNDSMLISKNHGMIRATDFNAFPSAFIDISSGSSLGGLYYLRPIDVFNFDVNDEFHYTRSIGYYSKTRFFTAKRITGKQYNADSSAVTYNVHRCELKRNDIDTDGDGGADVFDTIYIAEDDITETFDFNAYVTDSSFNMLSSTIDSNLLRYYKGSRTLYIGGEIINSPTKNMSRIYFKSNTLPDCYINYDSLYYTQYQNDIVYSKGFGAVYRSKSTQYTNLQYSSDYYGLVYFKKGTLEVGSPLDIPCSFINSVSTPQSAPPVTFVKSPDTDQFIIYMNTPYQKSIPLSVFGVDGKNYFSSFITLPVNQYDVSFLPKGIYIAHVTIDQENYTYKFIIQ